MGTDISIDAEDLDEEDRRPTQRRRIEQAQGHGFDEDEPMVRPAPGLAALYR